MKKTLRKLETSIIFVLKALLYVSLFWTFYRIYAIDNWQLLRLSRTSVVTIAAYTAMSYMFSNIYGRYDIGKRKSRPIVYSLVLMVIFTDIISLLTLSLMNTNEKNNHTFVLEKPQLLLPIFAIQLLLIFIFAYGGNALYFMLYEPEECVIVTSSQRSLNEVVKGVLKYKLQYHVSKVADYRDPNLKEYIRSHDTVFIYNIPVKERSEIVEYCYQNMKNVYFNPDMHDVIEQSAKHILLDDTSMYGNYAGGLTLEQRFIKRAMDLFISVLAIILTSPIMLLAVILIKLDDGGSVIFKQNRATRDGKIFSVYKFRTMKEDVQNYNVTEADERITRVGGFLRKYRIDEIPQFFNVLKGEMSVVGPRPEMLVNIFNYTSVLPEYEYRLRVKAGITGYAQIAGKYNTLPKDKLVLDLLYIEEYSFWLDIKLMFQTLIVLFKKDSTEPFGMDNTSGYIFEEYVPEQQKEMSPGDEKSDTEKLNENKIDGD